MCPALGHGELMGTVKPPRCFVGKYDEIDVIPKDAIPRQNIILHHDGLLKITMNVTQEVGISISYWCYLIYRHQCYVFPKGASPLIHSTAGTAADQKTQTNGNIAPIPQTLSNIQSNRPTFGPADIVEAVLSAIVAISVIILIITCIFIWCLAIGIRLALIIGLAIIGVVLALITGPK